MANYYPGSYSHLQSDGTDASNTPSMSYSIEGDHNNNHASGYDSSHGQHTFAPGYYGDHRHSNIGLPVQEQYDQYQPSTQASREQSNLRVDTSVVPPFSIPSGGASGFPISPGTTSSYYGYDNDISSPGSSYNHHYHSSGLLSQGSSVTSASPSSTNASSMFSPMSPLYHNSSEQAAFNGIGSWSGPESPTSPGQYRNRNNPQMRPIVKNEIGTDATRNASNQRRHPNSKSPHECGICHRTFTAKHNYGNHMNSHYGIREYQCDHCGKDFGTGHVLKRHKSKKHPDTGRILKGSLLPVPPPPPI
ncbi:hypothetical protein K435DRAFT_854125 [Dendrothele bispora CBS 962.96]|uniref:C2H2-type domain-containing protein n=1 Tax=Dendrothele bispora (strain CBS 962.96) TaxID=1314807 RepID=A0A4S8MFX5_DENBC|nr:hypothetical protein K435DRAFT_854125 [Dendrothele bispora CBS 962.96]